MKLLNERFFLQKYIFFREKKKQKFYSLCCKYFFISCKVHFYIKFSFSSSFQYIQSTFKVAYKSKKYVKLRKIYNSIIFIKINQGFFHEMFNFLNDTSVVNFVKNKKYFKKKKIKIIYLTVVYLFSFLEKRYS